MASCGSVRWLINKVDETRKTILVPILRFYSKRYIGNYTIYAVLSLIIDSQSAPQFRNILSISTLL